MNKTERSSDHGWREKLASAAAISLMLVLLLIALPGYSASKSVLVLGDSISAEYGLPRGTGWVALMQQKLNTEKPQVVVINASISGETTAGGKTRLPSLLQEHKPGLLIIELGGNDGLRGLSLDATQSNFQAMLAMANKAGVRVLLLGMQMPPNYGTAYSKRFAGMYQDLSHAHGVRLVPFFLTGLEDTDHYFQPDRIHPNQLAQSKMLGNVWPALKTLLK